MEKITDKSYKNFSHLSRYGKVPYYYHRVDNKYVSGTTFYLDDSTPYKIHIVDRMDTFDSLALKYYNNPTLFWILCSFNHVQDPYQKLKEGQRLKIPSLATIAFDTKGRY